MQRPAKQKEQTPETVAALLRTHGINPFEERSGMPLNQAQRNLEGRTHYVNDGVLRSFVTKIHSVSVLDEGLVLGMVESIQSGPNPESGRVFRPVFFDVFGNVIYRPEAEDSFKTLKQAAADLWKQSEQIEPVEFTIAGLKEKIAGIKREQDALSSLLDELS